MLLQTGFGLLRSKLSHRIYKKLSVRIMIPFHPSKMLHPKIVKQIPHAIEIKEQSRFYYPLSTLLLSVNQLIAQFL